MYKLQIENSNIFKVTSDKTPQSVTKMLNENFDKIDNLIYDFDNGSGSFLSVKDNKKYSFEYTKLSLEDVKSIRSEVINDPDLKKEGLVIIEHEWVEIPSEDTLTNVPNLKDRFLVQRPVKRYIEMLENKLKEK